MPIACWRSLAVCSLAAAYGWASAAPALTGRQTCERILRSIRRLDNELLDKVQAAYPVVLPAVCQEPVRPFRSEPQLQWYHLTEIEVRLWRGNRQLGRRRCPKVLRL